MNKFIGIAIAISIFLLSLAGCGANDSASLKPLKPFDLTSGWCYKEQNVNTPRCIDLIDKEKNNMYQD